MTDNDDKNKRGGRDRSGPRPPRGDKPFRPREDGDRPRAFKPRGDKPFRPREDGDRPRSFKPRDGSDRPPSRDFGDRPPRRDREDGERKPFRSREGGDRPPRKDFGDRPPRRDFGDRPPRRDREDGERKPFRSREGGDRPPRRDFGDRPPRKEFGDRPPRRDREDGDRPRAFKPRGERTFGDRPPRDGGDRKPFRSRDGGDRPPRKDFGDKPLRKPREAAAPRDEDNANRIAKVIARAGLCSRRDAEAWIEAGRVAVNGAVISSPALDVTDSDKIEVDGVALPARERTRLWLYHKPKGLETTEHSPEGRPTVFDNLPPGLPRVMSVGRLDINTEGLLLLTNDGGLARVLAHPQTAWLRRYRVRVYGPVDQAKLDSLRDGITIEDPEEGEVTYAPIVARVERSRGDNSWLSMDLREGKNREIKKVLEHFGLQVTRLIRISFGPFQLGDMPEGTAEEIRGRHLRDQLGERLAEEAGCDFEGPTVDHQTARPERARPARPQRDRDERPRGRDRDDDRSERRDRFEDDKPERGSPQDREGRSKTAWSTEPLPERRRDSKKPGEKSAAATLGVRDDLKVTREKVADRKGREVKVERVAKIPQDVEDAPEYALRDPNRRFGKRAEGDGERRPYRSRDGEGRKPYAPRGDKPFRKPRDFGDRPPRRDFGDRPPRREDGERKPFRPREDGDRPHSFKPRGDFGDRPPRREDGDRPRSFKPRDSGDRPMSRGKSFGDKPFGGKPRSFGGGKPFGGKPGGGRPGGKPGGFKPRGGPGGGSGGPRGGGADRRR